MIRLSTVLWLTFVCVLGFVMFEVKYEVMQLEDELNHTERQIAADQDSIHVLKAEWSYLSQPSRLAELNRRFLNLVPIATKQLGQIDSLPFRPAAAPEVAASTAATPHAPAAHPLPAAREGAGTRLANARMRTVP